MTTRHPRPGWLAPILVLFPLIGAWLLFGWHCLTVTSPYSPACAQATAYRAGLEVDLRACKTETCATWLIKRSQLADQICAGITDGAPAGISGDEL